MPELSISQAAARLGISEKTIRRRVEQGVIEGRRETSAGGYRWVITLPDLPDGEPAQVGHAGPADQSGKIIALLESQVADLRDQLIQKDTQIGQLHILMGQRQLMAESDNAGKWWRFWRS